MLEYERKTRETINKKAFRKLRQLGYVALTLMGIGFGLEAYSNNRPFSLERKIIHSLNPFRNELFVEESIAVHKRVNELFIEISKLYPEALQNYEGGSIIIYRGEELPIVKEFNNLQEKLLENSSKDEMKKYHSWNLDKITLLNHYVEKIGKVNSVYVLPLSLAAIGCAVAYSSLKRRREIKDLE